MLIYSQASGTAEGLQRMRASMIVPTPCAIDPIDYSIPSEREQIYTMMLRTPLRQDEEPRV